MAKLSKRMKNISAKVNVEKKYSVSEAFDMLREFSSVKFVESIDVSVALGVDPRKSDQVVRGASVLPNGTGKSVRVAVFAKGPAADAAKAAGAEVVGMEDLADEIKKGNMDFDVVIASPDSMRIVGQLGQILGPKGLMPNPKVGTVTVDVAKAVVDAKAGQVRYRVDKAGIIHTIIGKVNFTSEALQQNLEKLLYDLKRAKPANAKGIFLKKVSVSSTMGPGISVDFSDLTI